MSLYYSPGITSSGLILYLDAGDTRSYPGSGTTITDRTSNAISGTLVNGVGFNSSNRGSLTFDGITQRVLVNSSIVGNIGASNHTLNVWVNNTIGTEEDIIGTGGTTNGHVLLMIFNNLVRGHCWSNTNSNVINSPQTIPTNTWHMLTQTVTWGGNISIYRNGVLLATQAMVGSPVSAGSSQMVLANRGNANGTRALQGNIAAVHVYNRALSQSEILQNFEATRTRFGV